MKWTQTPDFIMRTMSTMHVDIIATYSIPGPLCSVDDVSVIKSGSYPFISNHPLPLALRSSVSDTYIYVYNHNVREIFF